ncbi:ribbon-helix-helix domain-containing protein [Azohydromonas australica]|uniref:ribbon-helix-helix domain-containing protein n=1 Tax=Azohydromonas australica TaxID=364039 RepID=UPI000A0390A7|nr:ribbon-helix-helix domain-containing protein [Azohydromonas australica]
MKRTNIHLSEQSREALQALSERTGITVSEHVRRAIDEYLKRNKAPAPRPAATSEKAH